MVDYFTNTINKIKTIIGDYKRNIKNMIKINLKKVGLVSVSALLALLLVGVSGASAAITSNLGVGSKGSQVSELQGFLATNPMVYPQGLVTGYYGGLTQAAVQQFQLAYDISTVGTVGPVTRAKINSIQASTLGLDLSAPMIMYTPSVQVTNTSATINWSTNEYARGKVVYSTSPIVISNTFETTGVNFREPAIVNGILASNDATPRLSQNVMISNLTPNTTYYYMIMALDASNNVSLTLPASFHTNQ